MVKSVNVLLIVILFIADSCFEGIRESPLIANFDFSFDDLCQSPELEVQFENSSENASSYLWDFGDGTTSTEANPKKVYARKGMYTVSLTAYNESTNVLATKEINIPRNSDGTGPLAYFEIVRENPQSLTFTFANKSQNADFCTWSISPGDASCGDISHTFATPGKYLIILYASNAEGTNCHREILVIDPVGG